MYIYHESPQIRLHQGDSTKLAWEDTTPIDCCISDPPYYQLLDYQVDGQLGFDHGIAGYVSSLVEVFRSIRDRLPEGGVLWLILGDTSNVPSPIRRNGQRRKTGEWTKRRKMQEGFLEKEQLRVPHAVVDAMRSDGWHLRREFIWDKGTSGQQANSDTAPITHAYVFQLFKWSNRGRPYLNCKAMKGTVLNYSPVSVPGHACPLPPGLIRELLTASTEPGQTILDPFAGSGQTLLTGADMGLNTIGYELNPEFCQLIADRDLATKRTSSGQLSLLTV